MRAGEAGHAWARQNVRAGLTELDVYLGVSAACASRAGQAVLVYGDFAVSPGPERRGGPPTDRVLEPGDMLILDYSVVIGGYRSDFTNTLVVGQDPTPDQQRLYELCCQALAAGERELRAVHRITEALHARSGVIDPERTNAFRLLNGEGDLLPGIVVENSKLHRCAFFQARCQQAAGFLSNSRLRLGGQGRC